MTMTLGFGLRRSFGDDETYEEAMVELARLSTRSVVDLNGDHLVTASPDGRVGPYCERSSLTASIFVPGDTPADPSSIVLRGLGAVQVEAADPFFNRLEELDDPIVDEISVLFSEDAQLIVTFR